MIQNWKKWTNPDIWRAVIIKCVAVLPDQILKQSIFCQLTDCFSTLVTYFIQTGTNALFSYSTNRKWCTHGCQSRCYFMKPNFRFENITNMSTWWSAAAHRCRCATGGLGGPQAPQAGVSCFGCPGWGSCCWGRHRCCCSCWWRSKRRLWTPRNLGNATPAEQVNGYREGSFLRSLMMMWWLHYLSAHAVFLYFNRN